MARPLEQRRPWTPEEDDKLKEFKLKFPDLPWPGIIQLAGLDRTDQSCWERWNYHLKPGVNKENSQEEDDTSIRIQEMPEHRNNLLGMSIVIAGLYSFLWGRRQEPVVLPYQVGLQEMGHEFLNLQGCN